MTQTKNFVIFARAWTSSPTPVKTPTTSMDMHIPTQEYKSLADISSSNSSSGTQTPNSAASAATTSPTIHSVASHKTASRRRDLDFSALEALFKDVPENAEVSPLWYILTTAVLLALHKEKLVGELWKYLSRSEEEDDEQLLSTARRLRESCLKASTLVGFPRVSFPTTKGHAPQCLHVTNGTPKAINALLSLKTAIEGTHPSLARVLSLDTSLRSAVPAEEKQARGQSFFQQIYRQHTARVLAAMDDTSGGDLTHFALTCIYGELLAEDRIVGGLETGLLEFVCCLADGCGPQAKGHFFGSINLGASHSTLRAAISLTEQTARQVGVACLWKEDDATDAASGENDNDDFRFLARVMTSQ